MACGCKARNRLQIVLNIRVTDVDKERSLSRRKLLQKFTTAPIAIGAFAALQTEAEAKAPQFAVLYRNKPHGYKSCHECKSYIWNRENREANGRCKRVAGPISPNGYCVLWHAGDNSRNT